MRYQPTDTIDQQLSTLKRRKLKLQQEQALRLLKQLRKILGHEFASELVCAMVSVAWQCATSQEREAWRLVAHPFRSRKYSEAAQTIIEAQYQAFGTQVKEVSTHDEHELTARSLRRAHIRKLIQMISA